MKPRTVVKASSLPTRLPFQMGAILFLLLDRFAAPAWLWGIVGTLYTILFLTALVLVLMQTAKDVPGFGEGR